MKPAELLEVIYQYYPREGDTCRRLEDVSRAAGHQRKKWLDMLARLRAQFPEPTIYDCLFDDSPRLISGEDHFGLALQQEYAALRRTKG